MSPHNALAQMESVFATTARECARLCFAAGLEIEQRTSAPAPELYEAVWTYSTDRLWSEVGEMLARLNLRSDIAEHLQFVATEEFDGEFDRLNEAWMGDGGRA